MPSFDPARIRVLAADDHALVRAGIRAMLACEPDIDVVAEAANGAEAVALYLDMTPDVVLMDLRMPILTGVAAMQRIRGIDPAARIIAITTFEEGNDIRSARSAGACAYVLKENMPDLLVGAIRSAVAGHPPTRPLNLDEE